MPSALLIHGLSAAPASMWRPRAWLEAEGWTVDDHSPLGHGGRGPAPSYAIAAQTDDLLQTGPWDLVVGHSLGGTLATAAAAMRPGWVGRLVVIDPAWRLAPEVRREVRAGELEELSLTREAIELAHPDWDERDVGAKLDGIAGVLPEAVAGAFDDNPDWDVTAAARALTTPTLLVTGDPDVFTLLEPALAREISTGNSRMTWRMIPGAGHAPHRDRPEVTRVELLDWLTRA